MSGSENKGKDIKVCVTGKYDEKTGMITGGEDVKITVGDTNGDTSFTGDDAVNDALKQLKPTSSPQQQQEPEAGAGNEAADSAKKQQASSADASVSRTLSADLPEPPSGVDTSGDDASSMPPSVDDTPRSGMTESPTAVAIKNAQKKKAEEELAAAKKAGNQSAIDAAEEKLANLTAAGGGRTRAKRRRPKRVGTKKKKRTKRLRKKGRKTKKC